MIKGIDVTLYERVQTGVDGFNRPEYEELPVTVSNVLIAPVSASEIITDTDLSGAKEIYQLAIPKGDTHNWRNATVSFFGQAYKAVAVPKRGIEELIPGDWNMQVTVARYE